VPQWSPDGRKLAYITTGVSKPAPNVFVIPAAGGVPEKVTDDDSFHDLPSWSRDGRWIYFVRADSIDPWTVNMSSANVWKVPAAGGQAIQVTRNGGLCAHESPDGKWLYFCAAGPARIRRAPLAIAKLGLS
jgi:Tol biopolymer transport system component